MKKACLCLLLLNHIIFISAMNMKTPLVQPGLADVMSEVVSGTSGNCEDGLHERNLILGQHVKQLHKALQKQQETIRAKNDEISNLKTQKEAAIQLIVKLQKDNNTLVGLLAQKDSIIAQFKAGQEKDLKQDAVTLEEVACKTGAQAIASPNASFNLQIN